MPGYILHLTEAAEIVRLLRQDGLAFSPQWVNAFCLGALLPDTVKGAAKASTHFWRPGTEKNMAIAPDTGRFLARYGGREAGPLLLGYWAHLELDRIFVEEVWPETMAFRRRDGAPALLKEETEYAEILRTGERVPRTEFFSPQWYYGDYGRMNSYLMQKHGLRIPRYDPELACPVREVRYGDVREELEELRQITLRCAEDADDRLRVFTLPQIEAFIEDASRRMAPAAARALKTGALPAVCG